MPLLPDVHIHVNVTVHPEPGIVPQLDRLESTMATAAEQLAQLDGRFDDFAADVQAKLDILGQDRENFSEAGQAAFDALSEKLAALDTQVGDADGSDTPPVEPGDGESEPA